MKSIEDRKVFCDLAGAIADALEHPECPRDLADALLETLTPLEDLLSGSATAYQTTAAILRALSGLNQSGDGRTRAEGETPVLDRTDAILEGSERESEALAKASTIH